MQELAVQPSEAIRRRVRGLYENVQYRRDEGVQTALKRILADREIYIFLRGVLTSKQGLALGISNCKRDLGSLWCPCPVHTDIIYGLTAPDDKTKLFILEFRTSVGGNFVYNREETPHIRKSFPSQKQPPINKHDYFSGWPSTSRLLVQTYAATKNPKPRILDLNKNTVASHAQINSLEKITLELVDKIGFVDPFFE